MELLREAAAQLQASLAFNRGDTDPMVALGEVHLAAADLHWATLRWACSHSPHEWRHPGGCRTPKGLHSDNSAGASPSCLAAGEETSWSTLCRQGGSAGDAQTPDSSGSISASQALALHEQAEQQGFRAALAVDTGCTNAWLGIAESRLTLGRMAGASGQLRCSQTSMSSSPLVPSAQWPSTH